MTTHPFEYSPRPQAEYITRVEGGALKPTPHWNLLWTMIPELDQFLTVDNVYTVRFPKALSEAFDSVILNPTVKRHAKVLELSQGNPKHFIDYLNEMVGIVPVAHLDVMEARLTEAYARYLIAFPAPNNVIQFRPRAA